VTESTASAAFPLKNFVAEINPTASASALVYSTCLGGSAYDDLVVAGPETQSGTLSLLPVITIAR
jgi:hypothetical protein